MEATPWPNLKSTYCLTAFYEIIQIVKAEARGERKLGFKETRRNFGE